MNNQEAVQGGSTIPVSISIQGSGTAAASRKSLMQLIAAASVLSTAQLASIIGGMVTARAPASGTPPAAAPATRADFSFGWVDTSLAILGTGVASDKVLGIADAGLIDYAGVGEELDLKAVEWMRYCVPLSLTAGPVPAIVRVYLRMN